MKRVAIVNPVAGSGRGAERWPEAEKVLRQAWPGLAVHRTLRRGHASELATEALAAGAERLIVCGGDGTIGEVVHGLLAARGTPPPIGIIPAGTGSDLARNLRWPASASQAAARIVSGLPHPLDAGRVMFTADNGTMGVRHFVNVASLGLSGPTARAVNDCRRKGGGKVAFLVATIRELIRYRFQDVRISVDGSASSDAKIALVAVANGRWFGGGMKIAPDALDDDGRLDVVVVRAASKGRLLAQLRRLYDGTHVGLPEVSIVQARRVTIEPVDNTSGSQVLVEADGEGTGRCPATFEVLAGALQVIR